MTRRVVVGAGGPGRIAWADRSWAMVLSSSSTDGEVALRVDSRGQPLSPQTQYVLGSAYDAELCWTGSEMTSSWIMSATSSAPGEFFRRLGPWGNPSSDAVTLSTGPVDASNFGVLWNGYEFGTFWAETNSFTSTGEHMARIDAESNVIDSQYFDRVLDQWDSIAWSGSGYGRALTRVVDGYEDIYFMLLSPAGVQAGPLVRLTDHRSQSTSYWGAIAVLAAMNAGQGYGVVWQDNRTGERQLWFARLLPDGTIVTPPGQVQLTNTVYGIGQSSDLVWTGSEFMAVWINGDATGTGEGKIFGSRISSSGSVLETEQITPGPLDLYPKIAWNGKGFGLYVSGYNGTSNGYFVSVDCNCTTDADGDGVLPCGGGDCDDSDPTVAPGLPEICDDGKDNNCDGLVDCNDPTCVQGGSPPGEIGNVRFPSDKTTIAWNSDSKATRYDVARGVLGDLRDMQNFRWTNCFVSRTTATSAADSENPSPGTGFYYIVRGRAKTCLLGTWGSTLSDSSLHGCP
jgi:hypothetical protein